jgi:hypothetical protein
VGITSAIDGQHGMGKRTKHDYLMKRNQIINFFLSLKHLMGGMVVGHGAYDCMAAWMHVCIELDSSSIFNHMHTCNKPGQH